MIKTIKSETEDEEFVKTNNGLQAISSKTTIKITISEIHQSGITIQKQMIQTLIEALSETIK